MQVRRRSEPIKINEDPNCPGVDIYKGNNLDNWELKHTDKYRASFSHIPKERWEEIFGEKRGIQRLQRGRRSQSRP